MDLQGKLLNPSPHKTIGQGGQSMKKRTLTQRALSLLFTLSMLSLLLSGSAFGGTEDSLNSTVSRRSTSIFNAYDPVREVCCEELITSRAVRLTRTDTAKRQSRIRLPEPSRACSSLLYIAAAIIYLILFQLFGQSVSLKRYIIKYIHDQDGFKNRPSLY